jgi:hypothetical protein
MTPEVMATVPPTMSGLRLAISTTLSLRRHGYKTRLAERKLSGFTVLSVVATPPARLSRTQRGL